MRKLSDYNWTRIILGLTAIFGTGGLWDYLGFAKQYPHVTPWIILALAVLALFFNTGKEQTSVTM